MWIARERLHTASTDAETLPSFHSASVRTSNKAFRESRQRSEKLQCNPKVQIQIPPQLHHSALLGCFVPDQVGGRAKQRELERISIWESDRIVVLKYCQSPRKESVILIAIIVVITPDLPIRVGAVPMAQMRVHSLT